MRLHRNKADWNAADLRNDESWTFHVPAAERECLRALAARQLARGLPLTDYDPVDFPLGQAGEVIRKAVEEVRHGRGVAIVKGLPTDSMSDEEFQLLTWGIGLQLGVAVPQGKSSQLLSAVRDAGVTYWSGVGGRGYSSRSGLDFHNDGSDIAILSCLRTAKSGGQSLVASTVRVHNDLVERQPDLARTLYGNYWFTRQGEEAPDEKAVYATSIFGEVGGELFARYNRKNINFAQGKDGVPPLTDQQIAALDAFDLQVRSEENCYRMYLEPGDIQIMNDYRTVHSRTEFEDHPEPERRRTLFRLWLSLPGSEALPQGWQGFYRLTAANSVRGGIRGHKFEESARDYTMRQATRLGMDPGR
jgi:alpha-ketoglutarate-dependent taurine dioxygenase